MNGSIDRSGKDTTHNDADPAAVKGFTLNMPMVDFRSGGFNYFSITGHLAL